MNGQMIIVGIILLLCVFYAGYRVFQIFGKSKTTQNKKCGSCPCDCPLKWEKQDSIED